MTTTVVAPAVEPLKAGDKYVVHVGRFMKIRCRVLESSSPGSAAEAGAEMVFDAAGRALGGIVDARFRFTVFRDEDGVVTARAQEKMKTLPLVAPSAATLENEHRHTFRELNASFRSPDAAGEAAGSGTA